MKENQQLWNYLQKCSCTIQFANVVFLNLFRVLPQYEVQYLLISVVAGRRGRIRRKLLDDLKERRGYSHLKEEALDRTMWRAGFRRSCEPVVRETAK
jgi:hypothetical protein